jgi:integrase
MAKLRNKSTIDAAKPKTERYFLWDDQLPGYFLRVSSTGRKVLGIQYRNQQGRTRRVTVARVGTMAPEEAWKEARRLLSEVDHGEDPAQERDVGRAAQTMKELAERYLEQHARRKKKPSSVKTDEGHLERIIKPALGHLKVAAVTRADVAEMHYAHRDTPVQANRAVTLAHKMFELAERWGLRDDGTNPCRHVDRYPEKRRERFLSPAELGRLGDALTKLEGELHPSATLAVRLLVLTGARRSEILKLTWEEVDLERSVLSLRDSKTGAKEIPFGAPARRLLAEALRERGNPYVCFGTEGGYLVGIDKPWRKIRAEAGMPNLRLHDLRHSFASVGAAGGESLLIVGKLLGHARASTTERYAHLDRHPAQAAAERISEEIAAALEGRKGGEVVPIKEGGA